MTMSKFVQAKAISDSQIVLAVNKSSKPEEIVLMFPDLPRKIVLAKLRQATNKRLIERSISLGAYSVVELAAK